MNTEQVINEVYQYYMKRETDRTEKTGQTWTPLSIEEFIDNCKTDSEFSEKWGLKIEERELSAKERTALGSNGSTKLYDSIKEGNYYTIDADIEMHKVCDEAGVPKRAITITYNNKAIESYEY